MTVCTYGCTDKFSIEHTSVGPNVGYFVIQSAYSTSYYIQCSDCSTLDFRADSLKSSLEKMWMLSAVLNHV